MFWNILGGLEGPRRVLEGFGCVCKMLLFLFFLLFSYFFRFSMFQLVPAGVFFILFAQNGFSFYMARLDFSVYI